MHPFTLILAALLQQNPTRDVTDPGVIATGQRVTPAGVQSVFTGRVGGVRFGATSDEIWVATPGSVQRVAWRDNRTLARMRLDGRAGFHSLVVDTARKRVLASSVGRLAGARTAVTQLSVFDASGWGDSTVARANSGALGDYMAGGPAIAGKLVVLPLPANDSLAVLDADSGTLIRKIALGVEPIAAVIAADSRVAWVSIFGGPKPTRQQLMSMQCCYPRAEAVRVDARG